MDIKENYFLNGKLAKDEANDIFEMYERDFNSFQSSKLRAIGHCERKLRISIKEEHNILWEAIMQELKKNF